MGRLAWGLAQEQKPVWCWRELRLCAGVWILPEWDQGQEGVRLSEWRALDGKFGTLFWWQLRACRFLGMSRREFSKWIQKNKNKNKKTREWDRMSWMVRKPLCSKNETLEMMVSSASTRHKKAVWFEKLPVERSCSISLLEQDWGTKMPEEDY